jgi:bifunctional non-homologous end joining protein LigD
MHVQARGHSSPLPTIRPMLLESGRVPDDDARHLFEVKYDGWRVITYVDKGALRVVTRRGREIADQLRELVPMAARLKRRQVILDGELVVVGADGKPDFAGMSERMSGQGRGRIGLMLFDVLYLDGETLVRRALEERKRVLGELELNGEAWHTVSYSVGNGAALLAASREERLEGLIGKRLGSKYTPGRRTRDWVKIKNFETREMVVGGWLAHSDGTYGVLVGDRRDNVLVFGGVVDIGIGPQLIAALETIQQTRTPFAPGPLPRGTRHCQPRLIGQVQYLAGSEALRHAVLRGVRVDE